MGKYDGSQVDLAEARAPLDCDRAQLGQAIALFAGAAAALTARLSDELCEVSRYLTPEQRDGWAGITSFLMELADMETPDEDPDDRAVSFVRVVIEANAKFLRENGLREEDEPDAP